MSKVIQGVLASRRELVGYDQRIVEFGTGVVPDEGGSDKNNGASTEVSALFLSLSLPPSINVYRYVAGNFMCFFFVWKKKNCVYILLVRGFRMRCLIKLVWKFIK